MFIKAIKATWDECYKSERTIEPTIEAVAQYLAEQFRVVPMAKRDITVEKIIGIVGKPVWPTFEWATHFVKVDGRVMAYTDGPIKETVKTGPKTIEELYREHLIRVEVGHKEEQSAWRFARAVGEILNGQVCGQSASEIVSKEQPQTILGKPVIEADIPFTGNIEFQPMRRKPRLTIDGKEIPFESITITTMAESGENL